jgi:hypothetical protein
MRMLYLGLIAALLAGAAPVQAADKEVQWPVGEKPAQPLTGVWEYKDAYTGEENDIKNPNRTQEEVLAWAQQRAADVMSFTPDNIDKKLSQIQGGFVSQGWEQYKAYMQESDVLNRVKAQGFSVVTIVNGEALILNSGTGGTQSYHWLVEMPLMVTLSRAGMGGDMQPMSGGSFKLIMQLGRVASNRGVDGLAVESWKIQHTAP